MGTERNTQHDKEENEASWASGCHQHCHNKARRRGEGLLDYTNLPRSVLATFSTALHDARARDPHRSASALTKLFV